VIACLAHNLLRWTEVMGLAGARCASRGPCVAGLLALLGRLTTHAGRWIRHLLARWPWQTDFIEALPRIRALPAAA
jgi:hypothetical protein